MVLGLGMAWWSVGVEVSLGGGPGNLGNVHLGCHCLSYSKSKRMYGVVGFYAESNDLKLK